ncbi:unnamed protein product, partial [marine sediment metagenome]
MTDKSILHTLQTGGSPHGLHQYLSRGFGCGRRAALDAKAKEETGTALPTLSGGSGTGTIGHALMELHFRQILDPKADPAGVVEFEEAIVDESARVESERVFTAWRDGPGSDPKVFGNILHVEANLGPNPEVHEA